MSLIVEIFESLWNTELNYKGIPVNIFGIPRFGNSNKNSIKSTLSKLKRRGWINNNEKGWYLMPSGKKYFNENYIFLKKFKSLFTNTAPKNLLIMFDVPEEKRRHRDWLRRQLREYDFIMIQRSVWVGPSPLPEEFTSFSKSIKIDKCLKTFKLSKPYTAK